MGLGWAGSRAKTWGSLCLKLCAEGAENAVGLQELLRLCGKQGPGHSTFSRLLCCGTFLKIHASGSVAELWVGNWSGPFFMESNLLF